MKPTTHTSSKATTKKTLLKLETLEQRDQPSVTAAVAGGTLTVTGDAADNRITVFRDGTDVVVAERGVEVFRTAIVGINLIKVAAGDGDDVVKVDQGILINTVLDGGNGVDRLSGGGALNSITGGEGNDVLKGGLGLNSFGGGDGTNNIYNVGVSDAVNLSDAGSKFIRETVIPAGNNTLGLPQNTLTSGEVDTLLQRAAAASSSKDAIIVITDRNGRILGVRVESGVDPAITGNTEKLVFAIDGAYSLALTGAYFASFGTPLTSRTIQNISQSTMTQREVDADPNITDPNSTDRGPGFVANVGINGHFPNGIAFTPQVDLFQIEHTNRDSLVSPGADGIKGTADDVTLAQRFDVDPADVPAGQSLFAPASYGVQSGLMPTAQSRGIGTLPGGIPIMKGNEVVGGIGVFFPGKTGFATEENSSLSTTYDPTKPDRTLEAEYIAFATLNRNLVLGGVALPGTVDSVVGALGVLDSLKLNSIYLVGINLEIFGPGVPSEGAQKLLNLGAALGQGDPLDGAGRNIPLSTSATYLSGRAVPEGWLVTPHAGGDLTAADVEDIINRGIQQANATRAAIRLPLGNRARMVFAVADKDGNILGLYRQPDSTIFSIDVAVAKARNVAYYADASQLQPIDQIDNVAPGTAFTNRSFRYLGEPRYPEGIDGAAPGAFSQLNDDLGIDRFTGLQIGARAPASQFQSAVGYDAFNPGTNFHDPNNRTKQNGIVFFPGSAPLYKNGQLVGGFGVSGDGVDQDDVVTNAGDTNFGVPLSINRVDQIFIRGVRVPYQKNLRNPEG
ncbi:heme-binding protein [Limnoglobus roseus]|uniref:Hemolysin-type calcium-binding region n=1 Tax=Limnoglobus roseus TaxID=2598579 RepID=A0A5C1AG47_9BACT|nr:heme-binding protein [Limnoglobus roseus]QEL16956.1 hemolysin-type calcium-binding region [Limnoglobus roseus]